MCFVESWKGDFAVQYTGNSFTANYMQQATLEKLTVIQLIKKFAASDVIITLNFTLIGAHQLSLNRIITMPICSYNLCVIFTIELYSSFCFSFPNFIFISLACPKCYSPIRFVVLDVVIRKILGGEYKTLSPNYTIFILLLYRLS